MNPLGPDVATIRTSGCIVFSHGGNGCRRNCRRIWTMHGYGKSAGRRGNEGANCHAVFSELKDLTAEARNKFTEEENG